jgi:hypothetical protein
LNWREQFITNAIEKHGNFFDYSKFIYVNAKTRSVIICPHHGEFTQTSGKHLTTRYPCPKCLGIHRKESALSRKTPVYKRVSVGKDEYVRRFNNRYPDNKYVLDLSNYVSLTQGAVLLTCPAHGESTYSPRSLLTSKYACIHCAHTGRAATKTRGFSEFVGEANQIHSNKYTYRPESTFINRRSKVICTCPEHGDFTKKAQKHLAGQGCFDCRVDELIATGALCGGYNESFFSKNPEMCGIVAYLYYIKVGTYYKVGITRNLKSRMKGIQCRSKLPVQVLQTVETTLEVAYMTEQAILLKYDNDRVARHFSTELFSVDVLKNKELLTIC